MKALGLHKTIWGTTRKCEKKIELILILIQFFEMHGAEIVKLSNVQSERNDISTCQSIFLL